MRATLDIRYSSPTRHFAGWRIPGHRWCSWSRQQHCCVGDGPSSPERVIRRFLTEQYFSGSRIHEHRWCSWSWKQYCCVGVGPSSPGWVLSFLVKCFSMIRMLIKGTQREDEKTHIVISGRLQGTGHKETATFLRYPAGLGDEGNARYTKMQIGLQSPSAERGSLIASLTYFAYSYHAHGISRSHTGNYYHLRETLRGGGSTGTGGAQGLGNSIAVSPVGDEP
ncbi:hypothetical protein FPV67DRAFT_1460884 [Lyophyllum atratum]|nr:hypothetical protein FPV67DRAFT_1460884 [Lyophyllum atratum]